MRPRQALRLLCVLLGCVTLIGFYATLHSISEHGGDTNREPRRRTMLDSEPRLTDGARVPEPEPQAADTARAPPRETADSFTDEDTSTISGRYMRESPSPPPSPPRPSFKLSSKLPRIRRAAAVDSAAAAAVRFNKHFPQLDGPPEHFRSSSELGIRMLHEQVSQPRRLVVNTKRTRRRAAEKDKDRWWRAVSVLHGQGRA